ncbi:hypothetical protein CQW23_03840 [Capsicum baccatum]|uniref:Uncharacterized protein n=1 Tax=Capsicum baccatum TaxID=33114 RepID=A0A2G2XCY2_CAPBA|nr:hypothetical protein CQW23_03840 [Capsicum baccatum]
MKLTMIMRDHGVFVAAYIEYISYEKGVPPRVFDVEALRTRYAVLLRHHKTQKIEDNVVSDDESPDRSMRSQFDCNNTDMIVIP